MVLFIRVLLVLVFAFIVVVSVIAAIQDANGTSSQIATNTLRDITPALLVLLGGTFAFSAVLAWRNKKKG
jgi:hypothetical protein